VTKETFSLTFDVLSHEHHCKQKNPKRSWYIQKGSNMQATFRQLANSTLKLANSTEAALK